MNSQMPSIIVSFIAPMLVLLLLFASLARRFGLNSRGAGWCVGLGLVSLGLLMIPIAGLPLARVIAAVMTHWSAPLVALLLACVGKTFFGVELLRREDAKAMWAFGVATGVVLYPMAMGVGSTDPFAYGWHFGPLFIVVGIIAMIFQWRRNRFGWVLLAAFISWQVGAAESENLWDCLVDPVFFLVAVVATCRSVITRNKRTSGEAGRLKH